ncbi:fatty acid-binding protein [Orussus abietinus]|uniref:fatty acid-binding protein n=1 Tax=Orussus abietinus TaxID=222816 RepID=UPI000626CFFD|nr:fatty acid-binding protein [Orussus abietinus]
MAPIEGKYQYERNENFEEFLMSIVGSEQINDVKTFVKSKPVIEVRGSGDEWTIDVVNDGKPFTSTFKLGEPYTESMLYGAKLKSITKMVGDKMMTETYMPDGTITTRNFEFTDTHLIVNLSHSKQSTKARRFYKRL